jgi:uncharacterized protein (UPF0371 family)
MGYEKELVNLEDPAEMCVNRIVAGVTDWQGIVEACRQEIARRIVRYQDELLLGIETPQTLQRAQEIQELFEVLYPNSKKTFLMG